MRITKTKIWGTLVFYLFHVIFFVEIFQIIYTKSKFVTIIS